VIKAATQRDRSRHFELRIALDRNAARAPKGDRATPSRNELTNRRYAGCRRARGRKLSLCYASISRVKAISMRIPRRAFLQQAAATAAVLPFAASCGGGDKKPPAASTQSEAEPLIVGGLPVTCNLTLPVACTARAAAKSAKKDAGAAFQYQKFSGWPEVKESLMSGRIQAAYMLAPLVMDLTTKKIPIKIVSLGHRSGAVIMVRTDSPYKHFTDLRGKRIAIPSRFAVDFLFLRKMLAKESMTAKDIEIVEMPPPDMPAALYANAVDAYCTGEPFGAAAQSAGYATPLRMTRDEWRNYICCTLTVREELIHQNRPLVQELVNYILAAGQWLDQKQENRNEAVEIACQKTYFNQDKKILDFVMEHPTDRVTYGDLRMIPAEFDDLMHLSVDAGTLKQPVPYAQYVDDSFVRAAVPAAIAI
jgi:NitT/TauT family transport system substrate-binding protein